MIDDKYIESLKFRISSFIENAKNKYEELREKSKNMTSYYSFNIELDELGSLIEDILYLKKQLARIENAVPYPENPLRPLSDEELSELRHKKLLSDKKVVLDQIEVLDKAIATLQQETFMYRLANKLEMEKFRIYTELGRINSALRIYESNPDLTDNEIDIYIKCNEGDIPFQGTIYLHGTGIEIGVIDYRGPVDSKWLGDIGYTISEEYRGHNYAYKALKLISPLIASKGIDKVTITTYKENIGSVKTIEKFGGVLTDEPQDNVLSYTCYTKPILNQATGIKK